MHKDQSALGKKIKKAKIKSYIFFNFMGLSLGMVNRKKNSFDMIKDG